MMRFGGLVSVLVVGFIVEARAEEPAVPTESVKIGPVEYTVPKAWKRQAPSNSMRVAQFGIPLAEGDAGKVEMVVSYFGPDQGGSVDQNIARWKGQFKPLEGKEKVETVESGPMKVTLFDGSGTFDYKPFPAAPQGELMENWRMLAGIVETPDDGSYYFRLVGPKKTIAAQADAVKTMLTTCKVAD